MNKDHIIQIDAIILEIEKVSELLNNFQGSSDIVDMTVERQMQRKKRKLFKELLKTLLSSNLSVSSYENLYLKAVTYLKEGDEKEVVSSSFRNNIKRAEALLAG